MLLESNAINGKTLSYLFDKIFKSLYYLSAQSLSLRFFSNVMDFLTLGKGNFVAVAIGQFISSNETLNFYSITLLILNGKNTQQRKIP